MRRRIDTGQRNAFTTFPTRNLCLLNTPLFAKLLLSEIPEKPYLLYCLT